MFSYPPSTCAVSRVCSFLFPPSIMPVTQCPVHGCCEWSNRWGKRSHPLPSADTFTLQLSTQVDLSIHSRICQQCWKRHADHTICLDGRIRVIPLTSPSALDALLSVAISPLSPAPVHPLSAPSVASLPSPPSTPARVITPFPAQPIVSVSPTLVQQQFNPGSTTVRLQSIRSPTTVQQQSNPSPTVLTSPRRTHSFPPVLDLSPAPSTYSERQRDVVASVMAGIDYERYRLQEVMKGGTPMSKDTVSAPSTFFERQRDVVASVMAGIDYERYRLQEVMKGGTPVSKDTWYTHQSTVYNSIIQIAENKEVEYLQMLRATGQRLVFCADAAWSHRGFEANQCCWLLLNAENKQIALAVILTKSRWEKGEEVHKGNYKGSSGGMEGRAMERGVARLKENGLLPLVQGWVCDKDSSVSEQLKTNPDTAHIPIHYDPGHIKKNFQKSLIAIYGSGVRYKGLAERGG